MNRNYTSGSSNLQDVDKFLFHQKINSIRKEKHNEFYYKAFGGKNLRLIINHDNIFLCKSIANLKGISGTNNGQWRALLLDS